MVWLITGLIVFFGVHAVPMASALRSRWVDRLGANTWRGMFSLVATIGLLLIIYGVAKAPYMPLWPPTALTHDLALIAVPIAFVFLAGAYIPSNIRRLTPHPMLWAVTIWAAAHVLANGDVASLLLFGSFLVYSLIDRQSLNRRGAAVSTKRQPLWADGVTVVVGLIVAALIARFHAGLFGAGVA